jgi:hypothetical protein
MNTTATKITIDQIDTTFGVDGGQQISQDQTRHSAVGCRKATCYSNNNTKERFQ